MVYKNVRIEPKPQMLKGGGWIALFYLIEDHGSGIVYRQRWGQRVYPLEEAAVQAAFAMGCRLIDES